MDRDSNFCGINASAEDFFAWACDLDAEGVDVSVVRWSR